MKWNPVRILIAVSAIASADSLAVRAQTPREIVEAIAARRQQARCMRYRIECDVTLYKTPQPWQPGAAQIPNDLTFQSSYLIVLDPVDGRVRIEVDSYAWNIQHQKLIKSDGLTTYANGVGKAMSYPQNGVTDTTSGLRSKDASIITRDFHSNPFQQFFWPLCFELGFVPVVPQQVLSIHHFHRIRLEDFEDCLLPQTFPASTPLGNWYGPAIRETPIWASGCAILFSRSAPADVLRYVLFIQPPSKPHRVMTDLQIQYDSNHLPTTWVSHDYDTNERKLKTTRVRLISREQVPDLAAIDFDMQHRPGMVVAETREKNASREIQFSHVEEDGSLTPLNPSIQQHWRWYFLFALSMMIAIIALLFRYLRKSRTHHDQLPLN